MFGWIRRAREARRRLARFRDMRNHVGETCKIIVNDNGPYVGLIQEMASDDRRVRVEWDHPSGPWGDHNAWYDASKTWMRVVEVAPGLPKEKINITLPNFDGRKA